jgi:uncharacterized membrane protein
VPHDVVGEEAAEYYTPERLAATGPFPLGQRKDLMFFNGRLIMHMDTVLCRGLGTTVLGAACGGWGCEQMRCTCSCARACKVP